MPEGPEVETIRRTLHPLVVGRVLGKPWRSRQRLRARMSQHALDKLVGRRITGTGRKGKLLWLDLEGGAGLMVRLGMTGRLVVEDPCAEVAAHTHMRWPLGAGTLERGRELRFIDPRRFGAVAPFTSVDVLKRECARLGPDAITISAQEARLVASALSTTKRALKDALLDQALLSGVGNIYACEALFRARLSPWRRGCDVTPSDARSLVRACQAATRAALARGGTSFLDYVDARGQRGRALASLRVFRREGEPCVRCQALIERSAQGARSTFYCPSCQGVLG